MDLSPAPRREGPTLLLSLGQRLHGKTAKCISGPGVIIDIADALPLQVHRVWQTLWICVSRGISQLKIILLYFSISLDSSSLLRL